jgi:hypothetical protein
MAVYLIAYDLLAPEQPYPPLVDRLEGLGAVRVLESTWLLESTEEAREIGRNLRSILDEDDGLLVVEVARHAFARELRTDSTVLRRLLGSARQP